MKKETPKIHVQSTEGHRTTIRQPTFHSTDVDVEDDPDQITVVSAFLAWEIIDEFGEADKVPLPEKVSKFLNTIYNRVAAGANIIIEGKSEDEVRHKMINRLKDPSALALLQNLQLLFQLYVPQVVPSSDRPVEMYWGAVYEIVKVSILKPETMADQDTH